MSSIFISYRRVGALVHARALFERLRHEFGPNEVFIDLEGVDYGLDFIDILNEKLNGCQIMLAVIDPQWATATDRQGRRRIDREFDYVRVEIVTALARGVRTVPVLIDGAEMPEAADLPEPLRPLTRRNALILDFNRFDAEISRLIGVIRRILFAGDSPSASTDSKLRPMVVPRQENNPTAFGARLSEFVDTAEDDWQCKVSEDDALHPDTQSAQKEPEVAVDGPTSGSLSNTDEHTSRHSGGRDAGGTRPAGSGKKTHWTPSKNQTRVAVASLLLGLVAGAVYLSKPALARYMGDPLGARSGVPFGLPPMVKTIDKELFFYGLDSTHVIPRPFRSFDAVADTREKYGQIIATAHFMDDEGTVAEFDMLLDPLIQSFGAHEGITSNSDDKDCPASKHAIWRSIGSGKHNLVKVMLEVTGQKERKKCELDLVYSYE